MIKDVKEILKYVPGIFTYDLIYLKNSMIIYSLCLYTPFTLKHKQINRAYSYSQHFVFLTYNPSLTLVSSNVLISLLSCKVQNENRH